MLHKQKKREQRRQARIQDWNEIMAKRSREAAVQQRQEPGGYRRPGNYKG